MLVIIQQTISEVQMTKEELKPIDTSKYKITETGQVLKMTKDEMKNRISMALKDPLLQQGFEIICKENAELKAQKQLTKAKELIKEMLSILPKENIEGIYEITEEAEQFLKE